MKISFLQACALLQDKQVIAIPTETVYGLAAPLDSEEAIEKIFALKNRPAKNPLIIHVDSAEQVLDFAQELPPQFHELTEAFWPGPLTLVIPVRSGVISSRVTAGLPSAAFRMPAHHLTQQLLHHIGPLVAPSANLSGRPSPTTPEHVASDFGEDFPILDGGHCTQGMESTILYFIEDQWAIIRLGALPAEVFRPLLGYEPRIHQADSPQAPLCPGQLFRHYAPQAKLILSGDPLPGRPIVGFAERAYPAGSPVLYLGPSAEEAAYHLYDILRQIDARQFTEVWVDMNFPDHGLWLTIRERIKKAAGA